MSDSSIPNLLFSQQDGITVELKNSVNFFEGTMTQLQTFFTMTGQNEDDGLNISISALYQCRNQNYADLNNAESPTGNLGLGWKLNLCYIYLDSNYKCYKNIRRYKLHMEGNDFSLIKKPVTEKLFSFPKRLWKEELSTKTVPKEIVNLFHIHRAMLSSSAVVEAKENGVYRIYDDTLQQAYIAEIKTEAGEERFDIRFDGESYQTDPYSFLQITYISCYERWNIVKEDKSVASFGGGVHFVQGTNYKTSEGNSIVWHVCWTDDLGTPIWAGAGKSIKNQKQYATAWYQNRIYGKYGGYISISYNEFKRDADGLLKGVEKLVTTNGYPYTSACYLTSITDVFNRKACLIYKEKIWESNTDSDVREYGTNYVLDFNSKINGYQECYETMYLDEIVVTESDNAPLIKVKFDYGKSPMILFGQSGDFAKRLLMGYNITSSTGEQLAGSQFEYIIESKEKEMIGNLKKTIYSTDSTKKEQEYDYKKLGLDICQHPHNIKPPLNMPKDSHPYVWNRKNTTVIIWHHRASGKLSIQIATWCQLQIWNLFEHEYLLYEGNNINLSSLNVVFGTDYIAVSYEADENIFLHLFGKNYKSRFDWIVVESELKPKNERLLAPFCVWNKDKGKVIIQNGSSFFLAWQIEAYGCTHTFDIFTWNCRNKQWERKTERRENAVFLAVSAFSYVEVDNEGNVCYHNLNQLYHWQASKIKLPFVFNNVSSLRLSTSDQFAALTYLISLPKEKVQRYNLYLLRWNEKGEFLPYKEFNLSYKNLNSSWKPIIVSDCMVAVAGHLVRFDGEEWILNSSLCPENISKAGIVQYTYAYGPDYAVVVRTNNGPVKASFISFELDIGWLPQPIIIEGLSMPELHSQTANIPVAGGDKMFLIGSRVFYRNYGQSWKNAFLTKNSEYLDNYIKLADLSYNYQINSSTVYIQESKFLVCAMYNLNREYNKKNDIVAVFRIKNGKLDGTVQIIKNQETLSLEELQFLNNVNIKMID